MVANLAARLAVYLVADPEQTARDLAGDVRAALAGGVTCVQLRAKRLNDREAHALAVTLRALCAERGALFIVNDRLDLALAVGADGVHLGVHDLPLHAARRLAGTDFVIGYSPETDAEAANAAGEGADYLGVGPVFGTASKTDAGAAIGVEGLARRARLASVPVVGIGGIDAGNAAAVIHAGGAGVAVVGAILRSSDPESAAAALAASVRATRG